MTTEIFAAIIVYILGMAFAVSMIREGNNNQEMSRFECWIVILWPIFLVWVICWIVCSIAREAILSIRHVPWLFGKDSKESRTS